MSFVSSLIPRRRVVLLCVASLLLHLLTIGWVGGQIVAPRSAPPPLPPTLVAQLHTAPMVATADPPVVKPATPKPVRKRAPKPPPEAAEPVAEVAPPAPAV